MKTGRKLAFLALILAIGAGRSNSAELPLGWQQFGRGGVSYDQWADKWTLTVFADQAELVCPPGSVTDSGLIIDPGACHSENFLGLYRALDGDGTITVSVVGMGSDDGPAIAWDWDGVRVMLMDTPDMKRPAVSVGLGREDDGRLEDYDRIRITRIGPTVIAYMHRRNGDWETSSTSSVGGNAYIGFCVYAFPGQWKSYRGDVAVGFDAGGATGSDSVWTVDGTRIYPRVDGNVGIGTTMPGYGLDVEKATGWTTAKFGSSLPIYMVNVPNPTIGFNARCITDGWKYGEGSTNHYGGIIGLAPEEGTLFLAVTASQGATDSDPRPFAPGMYITKDGNVGVGTQSPTERLDVDGAARIRGLSAGGGTTVVVDGNGKLWKQSSSRRYKEDITNLETDPSRVLELNPVSFRWKATGEPDIGLIAEDVAAVLGDLALYDQHGRPDGVKYDKLALYLLSVVKAQQQAIAQLKKAEADRESLVRRIDALEAMARQSEAKPVRVLSAPQGSPGE